MRHAHDGSNAPVSNSQLLLAYVADLELEVDRLRTQSRFVQHEARGTLKQIQLLCRDAAPAGAPVPALDEIDRATRQFGAVLNDLQEVPGYHPAHDQVIGIMVRSLAEQVFRWQLRLRGSPPVALRLALETE